MPATVWYHPIKIQVEQAKLGLLKDWKPNYTMENLLVAIKNELVNNRKLPQPPDGSTW